MNVLSHTHGSPQSPLSSAPCPEPCRGQYGKRTVVPAPVAGKRPPQGPPVTAAARRAAIEASETAPARTLDDIDLGDSQLPINYLSPAWCPPETRIPTPASSPRLKKDPWLSQTCQQPQTLTWVEAQLEKRRGLEAQGKEFTFAPLMASLENMRRFISHIRQGRQFASPLTEEERKAMGWLEEKTAGLIREQAPYKRTVQLAMALMMVCEELTNRRVMRLLEQQEPAFCTKFVARVEYDIPLDWLTLWRWGGNNPDREKENDPLFTGYPLHLNTGIAHYLDRGDMLLYPSFQPLELQDFCRFGHLPVHPVGMITDYAVNADGLMMSPLRFALHDIDHMALPDSVGRSDYRPASGAEAMLCSPCQRLTFRQLLLDQLPDALASLVPEPARHLLLFQLFHELNPASAAVHLESGYSAFSRCLAQLAQARRQGRAGYQPLFQQVTDTQAGMTALWTLRLWQHWQAADKALLPAQLQALAQDFVQVDVPWLQQHLAVIDQHRGTLRQLFAGQCRWDRFKRPGNDTIDVLVKSGSGGKFQPQMLFRIQTPEAGLCHLDNTDLVYFEALRHPPLRREIERKTGTRLPEDPFDQPVQAPEPAAAGQA